MNLKQHLEKALKPLPCKPLDFLTVGHLNKLETAALSPPAVHRTARKGPQRMQRSASGLNRNLCMFTPKKDLSN